MDGDDLEDTRDSDWLDYRVYGGEVHLLLAQFVKEAEGGGPHLIKFGHQLDNALVRLLAGLALVIAVEVEIVGQGCLYPCRTAFSVEDHTALGSHQVADHIAGHPTLIAGHEPVPLLIAELHGDLAEAGHTALQAGPQLLLVCHTKPPFQ